jgi:hypothetical protein
MEWNRSILLDAERRIRATGTKLNTFCVKAGIDRSSWTLWKHGRKDGTAVTPRADTWAKVEKALHRLEARRFARAA